MSTPPLSDVSSHGLDRGKAAWALLRSASAEETLRVTITNMDGKELVARLSPCRTWPLANACVLRLEEGWSVIDVTSATSSRPDYSLTPLSRMAAMAGLVLTRLSHASSFSKLGRSFLTLAALVGKGHWQEIARKFTRQPEASIHPCPVERRVGQHSPPVVGRIRVAMVAHSLELDGAPLSQWELAQGLFERGGVVPVLIYQKGGPLLAEWTEQGFETHGLPSTPIRAEEDLEGVTSRLADLFRNIDCHVVMANTMQCYAAILGAARAGLPSILNPRESEDWRTYFDDLPPGTRGKALSSLKLADRVVFVAQATQSVWQPALAPDNTTVIPNALRRLPVPDPQLRANAREKLGLSGDGSLLVLCLGTLCERKGQEDLLRAMAFLPDTSIGKLTVALAGRADAAYLSHLNELAGMLSPERQAALRILPPTNRPDQLYCAADIFVCTSRVESYPRVILEAMAWGLAVITTPVFGIAEQIIPGQSGLFYSPGDAKALAGHLSGLLDGPDLRKRLGNGARRDLARISDYPAMISRYAQLILSLAGQDAV